MYYLTVGARMKKLSNCEYSVADVHLDIASQAVLFSRVLIVSLSRGVKPPPCLLILSAWNIGLKASSRASTLFRDNAVGRS